MPSTLILDNSDPEVAEIVSQWQQGGRYFVTLEVTQQTPSEGPKVSFMVDNISDFGDSEMGEGGPPMGMEMPTPAVADLIGQRQAASPGTNINAA